MCSVQLDGIEVFVRVVEAGSFSAAARRLGMPKSTVSLHVSRLEKRLGVVLLKRTTRSVRTTEAGAAYLTTAARVLAELRAAEADVSRADTEPRGVLRISIAGTGGSPVSDLLSAFLTRYPEIDLELSLNERRVDLVAEDIDVAIRMGSLADDDRLVARRIGTSSRRLFASPEYLRRRGVPEHPRDLTGHEILRPVGRSELELVSEGGAKHRVPFGRRFTANRLTALRHQAIAGLGIASLPNVIAADVREGSLAAVLPEWRSNMDPVHVVYAKQRFVPQRVRAFVDFATRHLPPGAFGER